MALDLLKLNLKELKANLHELKCNLIHLSFIMILIKKILTNLLDGPLSPVEEKALKTEATKLAELTACPVPPDPPGAGAAA